MWPIRLSNVMERTVIDWVEELRGLDPVEVAPARANGDDLALRGFFLGSIYVGRKIYCRSLLHEMRTTCDVDDMRGPENEGG
jgi:hypothetical protein